ncbi:MAG: acyltransferase [Lachnospiraceae bacterium]|nr:acyltransferase [Lachnospiraceae bacterium]
MLENKKAAGKQLAETLLWLALGIFFILFLRWYGFPLGTKKLAALSVVILAAVLIHRSRSRKTPQYMRKVLGIQAGKTRVNQYDWLRILAVSMVILTHAVQMDLITEGLIEDEAAIYILMVFYVFCLACNLIYVMLSGSLLLPYREEKLSDFYLHRVSRVVLPMFVYYIFYLWINKGLEHITLQTIGKMFGNFFQGKTPECPHYWLLYEILAIYIAVPFLRYMLRDMPYKILTAMTAVAWGFMFFATYSPIPCGVHPMMASWAGIAIFGYWMTREETRKYDKFIVLSGVAGLGVTMYYIKAGENFLEVCCNCSPTMMMISGGLFSLVFMFPGIFSRGNVILSVLGKYSYSLILVHWTVLALLTKGRFHIYTKSYYYAGGIFLSWIVTLAVSLGMAFLIDNFVLVVAEEAYAFIVKSCRMPLQKRKHLP